MRRKRVILYARVSTLDKQHPEAQIEQLRAWAADRELEVVAEITDKMSGGRADRPGLNRAREIMKFRRADMLAATAIDRLGRSLIDLLELREDMKRWRCELVVLREAIDTSTPTGLYAFQVLGAGAQLQRANTNEGVRLGVRRAMAAGRRVGRARIVPLSVVYRAAVLRAEGLTWGQVRTRIRDEGLGDRKRGTLSRAVSRLLEQRRAEREAADGRGPTS